MNKNLLFLKHILISSIAKKSVLNGLLIIAFILFGLFTFIFPLMKYQQIRERKKKIQDVTMSIISIINHTENNLRKNQWKIDNSEPSSIFEAKRRLIHVLRDIRYDKTDFFFIIDGKGIMIMHPTKPELEGKNVLNIQNKDGVYIFKQMYTESQRDSETFIEHIWESKYSPSIYEPQITYSRYYWQWDWVVSTGVFIQDIDDDLARLKRNILTLLGILSVLSVLILSIFVYFEIQIPLDSLLQGIKEISRNNLSYQARVIRDDDIGYITKQFNLMVQKVQKSHTDILQKETEYLSLISNINLGVYRNTGGSAGKFIHVNPAIVKMFNYESEEEFLKVSVSDLYPNPKTRQEIVDILKKNGECKNLILKLKKKTGELFDASLFAKVQYDSNGNILWIDGIIEDITEQLKAKEELIQKNDRLEETSIELANLSANLELKVKERTKDLEFAKQEIEALNAFTYLINSHSDLNEIFIEISKYVYHRFKILTIWLLLPDYKEEFLNTFKIYSYNKLPLENYQYLKSLQIPLNDNGGSIYQVWKRQKSLYLSKIPNFQFQIDKKIIENTGAKSLLYIPLILKNKTIGLMAFSNLGDPMPLKKIDIVTINSFCSQITGVVNNMELLRKTEEAGKKIEVLNSQTQLQNLELEKTKREVESLNKLIKSLNENLDIKHIMSLVHQYILDNYNIQYYGLSVLEKNRDFIKALDARYPDFVSEDDITKINQLSIRINHTIGGHAHAFKSKKPFYIRRVKRKYLAPEELFVYETIRFHSVLIIPLVLQNEPIGFLDLYNLSKIDLSKEDVVKLSILGEQLAGIIYSSNLFTELQLAKSAADIEKGIAVFAQHEAESERAKSDRLLLNILPKEVAEELKEKGHVNPSFFESVTIMFTDFKGFTQIAEGLTPEDLIKDLDGCFTQFDKITERNNLEKLKTIGDSYMCAGGLPKVNRSHAIDCCLAALEIQAFMNQMKEIKEIVGLPYWELRLGIHTGPAIAGVIGEKKFAYDVWGDTVNTASRMESSGTPGKINISGSTYELVKDFFECEYRGKVNAKNKGEIEMYYLNCIKKEYAKDENGHVPNGKLWEYLGDLL